MQYKYLVKYMFFNHGLCQDIGNDFFIIDCESIADMRDIDKNDISAMENSEKIILKLKQKISELEKVGEKKFAYIDILSYKFARKISLKKI